MDREKVVKAIGEQLYPMSHSITFGELQDHFTHVVPLDHAIGINKDKDFPSSVPSPLIPCLGRGIEVRAVDDAGSVLLADSLTSPVAFFHGAVDNNRFDGVVGLVLDAREEPGKVIFLL
ncbi:hypothetical protein ES703_72231 [subsurface metagenome]